MGVQARDASGGNRLQRRFGGISHDLVLRNVHPAYIMFHKRPIHTSSDGSEIFANDSRLVPM